MKQLYLQIDKHRDIALVVVLFVALPADVADGEPAG